MGSRANIQIVRQVFHITLESFAYPCLIFFILMVASLIMT